MCTGYTADHSVAFFSQAFPLLIGLEPMECSLSSFLLKLTSNLNYSQIQYYSLVFTLLESLAMFADDLEILLH